MATPNFPARPAVVRTSSNPPSRPVRAPTRSPAATNATTPSATARMPPSPAAGRGASTDSPGTWRHPRLDEIMRRRRAGTFSDRNALTILYNLSTMALIWALNAMARDYLARLPLLAPYIRAYGFYVYMGLLAIPAVNIALCSLPLVNSADEISDIPLSPTQRRLLGLAPTTAPSSPNRAGYQTPPRYSRTPSLVGSVGSSRSQSSPASARAGLGAGGAGGGSGGEGGFGSNIRIGDLDLHFLPTDSPLVMRARRIDAQVEARSRRYSLNLLQQPARPSAGMLFGDARGPRDVSPAGGRRNMFPDSLLPSPGNGGRRAVFAESLSPSPTGSKRTSVGLNNKWLYERGRRSSGTWT